jgi:hypothetical protein
VSSSTPLAGHISRHTSLFDVLRDPRGREIIARNCPEIVASSILHTLHGYPVGLIVDTEESLRQKPELRQRILDELAALPPTHAPVTSATRQAREPRAGYESSDVAQASAAADWNPTVPLFGRFELTLDGPRHGNPYVDVDLRMVVRGPGGDWSVTGFYDGAGRYLVRHLALVAGEHRFRTQSTATSLDAIEGSFTVDASRVIGHGPVRVADGFHFAHADGTRFRPIGTTAYVWTHQGESTERATLATLADSPFTKMRMCVFPKSYLFNENEPEIFPFLRSANGRFDFERPDPEYWAHLERRIDELAELGIEADLILFHAYDRWGFSTMSPEDDDRFVTYAVARLSAFANVWWSLANEYDLLLTKTDDDWERIARVVTEHDPVEHLLSIHNCREFYDHSRPWVTHASVQRQDVYKTSEMTLEWRERWGKPVVVDECGYEGNIDQGWGNITGEEMTRRFWEGMVRGGYMGHGETYTDPSDVLWWAKGGVLKGTSPARIRFLRDIVEAGPSVLEPCTVDWDVPRAGVEGQYYLYYFGFNQPSYRRFLIDASVQYTVDVIDTWQMTVERLPGTFTGRFTIPLPGRPYIAVRLQAVDS